MPLVKMSPWDVRPPHEATSVRKLRTFSSSMLTRGWIGRPLVAVPAVTGLQALTGSHRLAAARKAGMKEIPVYVIDTAGRPVDVPGDDRTWLGLVARLGDPEATEIMRQETVRG